MVGGRSTAATGLVSESVQPPRDEREVAHPAPNAAKGSGRRELGPVWGVGTDESAGEMARLCLERVLTPSEGEERVLMSELGGDKIARRPPADGKAGAR